MQIIKTQKGKTGITMDVQLICHGDSENRLLQAWGGSLGGVIMPRL